MKLDYSQKINKLSFICTVLLKFINTITVNRLSGQVVPHFCSFVVRTVFVFNIVITFSIKNVVTPVVRHINILSNTSRGDLQIQLIIIPKRDR